MKLKLLACALFVISVIALSSKPASAHVLLMDPGGKVSAILHVNPDDDPIAGEPATLFYDIQGGTFAQHQHMYALIISDEAGERTEVPITTTHTTVSATYIFPKKGAYNVRLSAASIAPSAGHAHYFEHTQRVTRGTSGGVLDQPDHSWAEGLLIGVGSAAFVLVVVIINRRKEISSYSKW